MSRTINKVILVGNVGRDPDVFETKSGTKVVHLSLATNRPPFGDDDEQRTEFGTARTGRRPRPRMGRRAPT